MRDPALLSPNLWSYTDAHDLADAIVLAVESDLPGHEVFYIAAPDNVGNRPLAELVRRYYGEQIEIRPLAREDASANLVRQGRAAAGLLAEPVVERLPRRRGPRTPARNLIELDRR